MKNGLGEDITEGKISYPIVYLFSKYRGRKNSINSIAKFEDVEHASLADLIENDENNSNTTDKNNKNLFDVINNSNVYSNKTLKKRYNTIENVDQSMTFGEDLNTLVEILKEKTKDKKKISIAIGILKSKKFK